MSGGCAIFKTECSNVVVGAVGDVSIFCLFFVFFFFFLVSLFLGVRQTSFCCCSTVPIQWLLSALSFIPSSTRQTVMRTVKTVKFYYGLILFPGSFDR